MAFAERPIQSKTHLGLVQSPLVPAGFMTPSSDISRLLEIMAMLRTPGSGCPWDLVQNFATIAPYTIEEAYEVADAIARSDFDDLKDELGDLLLQVVFHARMAEEAQLFAFGDVVHAITAKLVAQIAEVVAIDRVGDLVGFLDRVRGDRVEVLLHVPRTAALRIA